MSRSSLLALFVRRRLSSAAALPLISARLVARLDRAAPRAAQLRAQLEASTLPAHKEKQLHTECARTTALARDWAHLSALLRSVDALSDALAQISAADEPEWHAMAAAERDQELERARQLSHAVIEQLLPVDEADSRSAVLELRAGTGGSEAQLFARDLLQMYALYAAHMRWKFDVLDLVETDVGGCREATVSVTGQNVFGRLKFESGVHRVQRVPSTEGSGRTHTSTATVAVLPEAQEFDVQINPADLRIDLYRASGAGGQHVNTTDSAVRITHLPTGVVVAIQDDRSQHRNKAKALSVLRSRLFALQRAQLDSARASQRAAAIGNASRSERMRTYNGPQDRVSDHRSGENFGMRVMSDPAAFDEMLTSVHRWAKEQEISRIGEDDDA
jgi:peptide chain release factor 1